MTADLRKMNDADRLALCRRYFQLGFACLPMLWAVNAIWFYRYAFGTAAPSTSSANATVASAECTAQMRRYVCFSAIGALCWALLFAGWILFYNIQRSTGKYAWLETITLVFPLGYV